MTRLVSHYIVLVFSSDFWMFGRKLVALSVSGSCVPSVLFGFLPSGNSVSGVSVSGASSSSKLFVKQDF
jgi:hypothetical protein